MALMVLLINSYTKLYQMISFEYLLFVIALIRFGVLSQLTSSLNSGRLLEFVNPILISPSNLFNLFLATSISQKYGGTKPCNCPGLKTLFKHCSNSLEIYYGLQIYEMCNCHKKLDLTLRHKQIIEYDSKVRNTLSYHNMCINFSCMLSQMYCCILEELH